MNRYLSSEEDEDGDGESYLDDEDMEGGEGGVVLGEE